VAALLKMLEEVIDFVDRVVAGKAEADSAIGCELADTLSAVPRVRPELFDSIFNGNLQDLLMVSYLASLTKANLAISEKLSGVRHK
jgi:translation initiation factor 3 subunit F